MSSLINSLKSEIARVARKELKQELLALRKTVTAHRSEIAGLKRQVKSLASALKSAVKAPRASQQRGASTSGHETAARQVRYSAERLTALRTKFGISKAQMATLLGVSYLTVHKWETGDAKPRAAQLQKIAAVAQLGKREVKKKLQEDE